MIVVTSLRQAHAQLDGRGARHAISILGPETPHPEFPSLPRNQHLRLTFHDIIAEAPGLRGPQVQDAERLLNFLKNWDREAPLLIHCWAGISRSTAAAYTALCLFRPHDNEHDLAQELRAASPSATPNRLIVTQVDQILGRNGRMVAAVSAIGRGADAFEGEPFILKVR